MDIRSEFDYVFKACAGKIHPAAINDLLSVPEFVEELQKFNTQVNIQILFELANRVRNEFYTVMQNEQSKQEYISMHGVEMWNDWKRRYRFLKNGCRKMQIALGI